ncbi:probable u3 small nucleolar rna-associatedprotein 11 [Lichtheimia corymbifera JMRC:FSU:9682]|uniref:U3 small nucleolar RNA-associated protein 11 n=1 Tax=Lichtheimia corymbifera JMRC:FSU:9682 TaxID=1263082 RepID=A0A068SEJ5_9FUNG|nr:probable u3 small nucleolar rna-associatedprotein 11 [Lichtheimia corymbifera JMRC:FSU:9682]
MSSSFRNAVNRRNHKERGQLAGRQRFGLLEKKKDYLLRAKDYHSKQKRLKVLREKALFRNPDEFYFKMINSRTKGGVHIQERNNQLPDEMVQLMKSQDKNYIRLHRDISKKKMERLRDSLHFIDQDEDEEDEDEDEAPTKKSNHVVFVDSQEEAKQFDPVKHLDTVPDLVNRKFNRPRIETLKKNPILAPENATSLKEWKKEREAKYKEFTARDKRETDLSRVERELEIQKALRSKGARKKTGVDALGLPVYKWKAKRAK